MSREKIIISIEKEYKKEFQIQCIRKETTMNNEIVDFIKKSISKKEDDPSDWVNYE